MLIFNDKVKVTTLKNLERDINSIYNNSINEFMKNDEFLDKFLSKPWFNYKLKVTEAIKEDEDDDLFIVDRYSDVKRKYFCSACNQTKIIEQERYGDTSNLCDCNNVSAQYIINKDDYRNDPFDDIENEAYARCISRPTLAYIPLTFYYPIVNQRDLFVVGQFTIKTYPKKDANGDIYIKAIPTNGKIRKGSSYTPFNYRKIFIVSKKYGLRFIHPNNGKILQSYNIPKGIKSLEDHWYGPEFIDKNNPVLNFDIIDKDLLEFFYNNYTKNTDDLSEVEFNSSVFIDTFYNYEESAKKRKAGVYRFDLTYFKKGELEKRVRDYFRDNAEILVHFDRTSDRDRKLNLVVEGMRVVRRKFDSSIVCNKCDTSFNSVLTRDRYVDNIPGVHLDSYKYFEKDVYCPSCGKKLIKANEDLVSYSSSDNKYLVVYDVDKKGRLVERIYNYYRNTWNDEAEIYEMYRTIFYEKSSPSISITYHKSNPNEEFKKIECNYSRVSTDVVYLQDKDEIRDVLSRTDYKYSALEEIAYKDNLNNHDKLIINRRSYLYKYLKYPSIELLARLNDYDLLLKSAISHSDNFLNPYAKNLKDAIGLKSEAFSILKKLPAEERSHDNMVYLSKISDVFGNTINMEIYLEMKRMRIDSYCIHFMEDIYQEFNIGLKSILNYIKSVYDYQRITDIEEILVLWRDYLRMANELGRDLRDRNLKYPNSLKREHDIVSYDLQVLMDSKETGLMSKDELSVFESLKDFEFEDGEFKIIAPKNKREIIEEGNALNHCVASYADRVAQGLVKILFMRNVNELDKPLYTIEVSNDLVLMQVRGKHNRSMNKINEVKFLQNFKKAKNIL